MAKSATFFGLRRGSTKSLTFQVNNGQQITKDRVKNVRNPRTEAQMIQRLVMNTVIRAYSQFQPLCDHSFEGVQVGMDSMKNFTSLNDGALRARVAASIDDGWDLYSIYAFTPKGEKYLCPNTYVVSRGSLPAVTSTINRTLYSGQIGNIMANTYEGVIDSLGLLRGDQLTFVTIEGNGPARIAMHYARVILDPQNADGSEAPLSSAFVGADNKINLPNVRNEGDFVALTFAGNAINYRFTNQGVAATGVIVSRRVNGKWKRSNCQLVADDATMAGFFPSLGECLDMVGQSDIATRNALFLNNAGRGRVAKSEQVSTLNWTTAGDSPIVLTGVSAKSGLVDEVATNCIAVVDANGNTYYIKNDQSQTSQRGRVLVDDNAYIDQGAWAFLDSGQLTDANSILWDDPTDSLANWLYAQGVSRNCWLGGF